MPLNCTNEQKYTNLVANVGDNVVLTVKRRKNKKTYKSSSTWVMIKIYWNEGKELNVKKKTENLFKKLN